MFRATVLLIIRNIRLYNAACGMNYPVSCRPVVWWRRNSVTRPPANNTLGNSYHKLHYTI